MAIATEPNKRKVDHPVGGKDVADSLAAVVHGLPMRRQIWIEHGKSWQESPSIYQVMAEQS